MDPTDRPVADVLLEIAGSPREGSAVPAQRGHFQALLRDIAASRPSQPVNVLEIGFNAGVSAAAWLEASAQAHVVSFDLADQPWVMPCFRYLQRRFPGRLHLVVGISQDTVPRFAAEAGARFDLLLIDGGHDREECRADLLNARALAAPGAVVVVDDLLPHRSYGAGVVEAWESLLREGVLASPRIWAARPGASVAEPDSGEPPESYERRWGTARFARL